MNHHISEESALVQRKIPFPLCFIIFFSVLNGTMFQVAVPDIAGDFQILPSEVSWVMTAYIVVFAIGTLVYGSLADVFPVKNLITTGLLLMSLGSLAGLVPNWYPMLIVARIMQAGGGAAIPALAMLIVTRYFEPSRRGAMFGIIASTVALSAAVGPVLGGFIAGVFHWKYLFFTSLPTIVTIPCFRRHLPDRTLRKRRFDFAGATLIGTAVLFLLLFITQGQVLFLLSGIASAVGFLSHIRRAEVPFVDPHLFRLAAYRNTVLGSFLSIGTVFGMMFMVPLMLRDLNGLRADSIGFIMFPGAMSAAIFGALGGRLSDRKGSRFVVLLGIGFLICGYILLAASAGQHAWKIALNLIICYTGFAFLQSALPHSLSEVIPPGEAGIAMGIYNLAFFISGAFSTALIGRTLDLRAFDSSLNLFASVPSERVFSVVFLILFAAVAAAGLLFLRTAHKR